MSSPTNPFAELQVAKSRNRGDITSLLPSLYDPSTDPISDLPVPEASQSLYTRERLRQSLEYAEKCLKRRDISPRSALSMQLYKGGCVDASYADYLTNKFTEIYWTSQQCTDWRRDRDYKSAITASKPPGTQMRSISLIVRANVMLLDRIIHEVRED